MVNWEFPGLDMGNQLWFDSNGLQMMKKILNQRQQFRIETNQTVSSNFYPVTSAISGRDTKTTRQVTVMNDRTQSGSAGIENKNNIQIMQHRRLLIDDSKGLKEPLDERD